MCSAPLVLTSATAYLTLALSTTATYTMGVLTCAGLATVGSLTCNGTALVKGDLTVNGNLNNDCYCWAAGKISSTGSPFTINGGSAWTCARASGQPTGVFRITFTNAHPLGSGNYTIFVTSQGAISYVRYPTNAPTSTYFEVILYSTQFALLDAAFSFMVMNW